MKIAFFNSHILWGSHYETMLEIAIDHFKNGDEVTELYCNMNLPACDNNPYFEPEACYRCITKRENGYKLLPKNAIRKEFLNLTPEDKKRIKSLQSKFESISQLQKLYIDNFDIGYAVGSSIITIEQYSKPEINSNLINNYIIGSAAVYFSVINYLKKNKVDMFYVFNGRLAHTKAVLKACQKMGVDCYLHERGNNKNHYSIFKNYSIHNLENTRNEIEKIWSSVFPSERVKIAKDFYNNRFKGKEINWYSFVDKQKQELPENWDKNKINIAIFNSTEHEFASLGKEWINPIYLNQNEGINRIAKDILENDSIHLYLRVHPNLNNAHPDEKKDAHNFHYTNLTVIPSDSLISSYNLMMNCDKVLTFGSMVGIEAAYFLKPSILAGKSMYYGLGSNYEPRSHEELIEMLGKDLIPLNIEGAEKFGVFSATFGTKYKHYTAIDFAEGHFKNKKIESKKLIKYNFLTFFYKNITLFNFSEIMHWKLKEKIRNKLIK
jgi:hypothetical protein